ncbi:MAG: WG repeat-containing protein [Oscillospiraceae bacterium]|nr:WG repeat-containing protein [Oscillospiraceae bacterium]
MIRVKNFSAKFTFLLLTAAFIAAIVLYRLEYYDIVFLTRESKVLSVIESDNTETVDIIEPPDDGYEDEYTSPAHSGENISQITNPSGIEGIETTPSIVNPPTYSEKLASIEDANNYLTRGWAINTQKYDKYVHKIVKFKPEMNAKNEYAEQFYKMTESVFDLDNMVFNEIENIVEVPVVTVYMGYYLINQNDSTAILTPQGKVIVSDLKNISPAYYRDSWNRPLFNYNGTLYVVTSDEKFVTADAAAANVSFAPALYGDYTSDYGRQKNNLHLFYEVKEIVDVIDNQVAIDRAAYMGIELDPVYINETVHQYGYKYSDDTTAIPAKYYYAYNFSENGLAVVANRDRVISIIDVNGRVVINPFKNIVYLSEQKRYVFDGYYLPDNRSMENIGMIYFDHGLMRIRRVLKDQYNPRIINDYDILIHADGSVFNIPAGYDLVYYSDGVLVLKKGDYYGCLDYTGKWIAQPFYTYAGAFKEGLVVLGVEGKKGMVDTQGNIVLPFIYDEITDVSSGVIAAYEKQNGWTFYNKIARSN